MSQIAILLCTYNGEKFLAEQLDSLNAQTHKDWVLYVSDDGSSDGTLDILDYYQAKWGNDKLHIYHSKHKNFFKNFLSLACRNEIQAPFYAFCDQDDVWLPQKLSVALKSIEQEAVPALYCSRTTSVDKELKEIGASLLFKKPPSFANALVQSIAGANTMLLNQHAMQLVREVSNEIIHISHDWYCYQLVSGAGGKVIYDSTSYILYRQHENNLVGTNSSFMARLNRLYHLFDGRFKRWNDVNEHALQVFYTRLTLDNQTLFNSFKAMRKAPAFKALCLLVTSKLYRQSRFDQIALYFTAFLKRL